jgi:hypothetical protein
VSVNYAFALLGVDGDQLYLKEGYKVRKFIPPPLGTEVDSSVRQSDPVEENERERERENRKEEEKEKESVCRKPRRKSDRRRQARSMREGVQARERERGRGGEAESV